MRLSQYCCTVLYRSPKGSSCSSPPSKLPLPFFLAPILTQGLKDCGAEYFNLYSTDLPSQREVPPHNHDTFFKLGTRSNPQPLLQPPPPPTMQLENMSKFALFLSLAINYRYPQRRLIFCGVEHEIHELMKLSRGQVRT